MPQQKPRKPKVEVDVEYRLSADETSVEAIPRLLIDGKEVLRTYLREPLPDQIEGWGWLKKGWKKLTRGVKKAAKTVYKGTKQVLRSKAVKQLFGLVNSPVGQGALASFMGPQGAAAVSMATKVVRPPAGGYGMQAQFPFPGMPQMMAPMSSSVMRKRTSAPRRRRRVRRVIRRRANSSQQRQLKRSSIRRPSPRRAPVRASVTVSPQHQFLMNEIKRLEEHLRWLRK